MITTCARCDGWGGRYVEQKNNISPFPGLPTVDWQPCEKCLGTGVDDYCLDPLMKDDQNDD